MDKRINVPQRLGSGLERLNVARVDASRSAALAEDFRERESARQKVTQSTSCRCGWFFHAKEQQVLVANADEFRSFRQLRQPEANVFLCRFFQRRMRRRGLRQ